LETAKKSFFKPCNKQLTLSVKDHVTTHPSLIMRWQNTSHLLLHQFRTRFPFCDIIPTLNAPDSGATHHQSYPCCVAHRASEALLWQLKFFRYMNYCCQHTTHATPNLCPLVISAICGCDWSSISQIRTDGMWPLCWRHEEHQLPYFCGFSTQKERRERKCSDNDKSTLTKLTSPVAKYLPSPENARDVMVFL